VPPAPLANPFPPPPRSFRSRGRELATLTTAVLGGHQKRFALIGSGGSGKSTLACVLGHRVKHAFPGGIHWFRVGAWDEGTLTGMLALRFGVPLLRSAKRARLRAHLKRRGPSFVVLDNHEDDRAIATLLDELRDVPVTWMITARRCLLAGVSVYPVVPPLVTLGKSPFPAVASLTPLLRWNPVALDLADALVTSGVVSAPALEAWLLAEGVDRVRVIDHEDDLPEVGLVVARGFRELSAGARRMMAVLAHTGGDNVDEESLATLAKTRGPAALESLKRLRLVQEPLRGRYALHATVRHAVSKWTKGDAAAQFEHYVTLLEQKPERLDLEQTHLYAAMDFAGHTGNLAAAMRLERLLAEFEDR
jgi:energy-coupling factor transporter ATP-binding protein EcfA2